MEFAIIVGLLFTIVFGIMEYGVAFLQMQTLRAGAREGARTAAVRGTSTEISASLISGSSGLLPNGFGGYTVTPAPGASTSCNDSNTGSTVTVTLIKSKLPASVQQGLSINIPFLPPINLNPTLSGSFRCE